MGQGRSPRSGTDGIAEAAGGQAPARARGRASRWPHGRKSSKSARSGRREAARARSPSCRNPGSPLPRVRRSPGRLQACQSPGERRNVVLRELRKLRSGRRGLDVDYDPEACRKSAASPAADLPNPTPESVAHDGAPRALAYGDPDARPLPVLSGEKKQLKMASGHADPGGVALFEFSSLSKAVVPGEGLPHNRTWAHTESLLRPLRRRAESTARPD
jgi:hypothetical protein